MSLLEFRPAQEPSEFELPLTRLRPFLRDIERGDPAQCERSKIFRNLLREGTTGLHRGIIDGTPIERPMWPPHARLNARRHTRFNAPFPAALYQDRRRWKTGSQCSRRG